MTTSVKSIREPSLRRSLFLFLAAVLAYAEQFTTPNKATKAVGLIKRSVQTGAEMPFELALALERELQAQLFASSDAKEGLNAYVEKRKAEFTGS